MNPPIPHRVPIPQDADYTEDLSKIVAEEDEDPQPNWPFTFPDPFLNRWKPLLAPLQALRAREAQRAELPKKSWPVLDIKYQGPPVSMFGPHNSPLMPRTWKGFQSGGTWDMMPAYHGQEKLYTNLFQRLAEEQRYPRYIPKGL